MAMDVKEKLVELLNEVQETGVNEIPAGFGYTSEYVNNKTVASHLIANGVTVQEWISVYDRLPEAWKQVLIYSRHDFCESAVYIGVPGKWRVTWNHEMLEADSVTHWMPLPEPPKEVEE